MTDPGIPWSRADNDTFEDYRGNIVLPGGSSRGNRVAGTDHQGLNTPSKPVVKGAIGGSSQKDRRFTDTFYDEHRTGLNGRFPQGRPWWGEREIAAMADRNEPAGFCTSDLSKGEYVVDENGNSDRAASFASVWDAPWSPYPKYFKFNYQRKRISFEYRRQLNEEKVAFDRYYEAAALLGMGLNVKVEYGEMPSFQITSKLGYPTRMIPIVEAAMALDPWLLGFIDEPNPKLAKILGFNERGMRILSYDPEPKAVVTPDQVLHAAAQGTKSLDDLIAEAVGKALAAERAVLAAQQAAKKAQHGEKIKAGLAKNRPKFPPMPAGGAP